MKDALLPRKFMPFHTGQFVLIDALTHTNKLQVLVGANKNDTDITITDLMPLFFWNNH